MSDRWSLIQGPGVGGDLAGGRISRCASRRERQTCPVSGQAGVAPGPPLTRAVGWTRWTSRFASVL